jgi:hypothetical protein
VPTVVKSGRLNLIEPSRPALPFCTEEAY